MFSSKRNVLQLLALLKAHGISRIVVSPGSRHIPVVISMECDSFFHLYSVVDERSASFFAIGLIQRYNEPAAIICTSGTASANYCSAISEAYYQELPLLVLTADRSEALRDQHEDQMIHQSMMYKNVAKFVANLPVVQSEQDAWFNNRLINEALLELNHHGRGPVQINFPVPEHLDNFETNSLPEERVICRYDLSENDDFWKGIAQTLFSKKVILVIGEGAPLTSKQQSIIDGFCNKFDCVVLSDKMSNCHGSYVVENAFPTLQALANSDIAEMAPDIVISIRANYSFNPEFKSFIKRCKKHPMENWYISSSGKVIDPFHNLTNIFEMDEFVFMDKVLAFANQTSEHIFTDVWTVIAQSVEEPNVSYSHLYTIGKFLSSIPANSVLHLSNSNSVRIGQLYKIDPSIEIHCNRGTDGIDGCMSTMVGFASETDKPVFLMIGDLTFFYDMNALWNRQLGKNIRILLSNNGGGAIMHMPKRPDFALKLLPNYISAEHNTSAKAWVEDRGFKYISATNEAEVEDGIKQLTDLSVEGPILLEVFTDMLEDTKIFKSYYASIRRETVVDKLKGKAKDVVKKVFHILNIQ